MKARLLASLAGAIVVAPMAWLLGRFFSGATFAAVLAVAATALCGGLAFSAGPLGSAWRRVAITAGVVLCGLAASIYTFGANEVGLHWSVNAQLVLACLAALACVGLALALRHSLPVPVVKRDDDPDITVEMAVTDDVRLTDDRRDERTMQVPAMSQARGPMLAGVAVGFLLVLTTVWLISGAGGDATHGGSQVANAGVVRSGAVGGGAAAAFAVPVLAQPGASANLAAPTPADTGPEAGTAETEAPAAAPVTNGPAPLGGSAARRECMAQIESARLFLQMARGSESRTGYVIASESQITRILKEKPIVGPRTLEHIAERMWDARGEPDRNAEWWSSQFSKCESTRRGGGYYIVRG